jgi:hypothetical protein
MLGIVLTLLAVLLVICLAFCFAGQGSEESARDLPVLQRRQKKD